MGLLFFWRVRIVVVGWFCLFCCCTCCCCPVLQTGRPTNIFYNTKSYLICRSITVSRHCLVSGLFLRNRRRSVSSCDHNGVSPHPHSTSDVCLSVDLSVYLSIYLSTVLTCLYTMMYNAHARPLVLITV